MKKTQRHLLIIHEKLMIDDVYENVEDYNPTKEKKVLIVFDNMIADLEPNKKLSNNI